MTVEELKEQLTMFDVLAKYGIKTSRNGMCSCPFHKDKKPSMKVYKDGYKCFSCNRAGDIFAFVQEYENCSFKDAFLLLGGTYDNGSGKKHILNKKKFERRHQKQDRIERSEDTFRAELLRILRDLEIVITYSAPLSDIWVWAQNQIPFLECAWDEKYIEGREVNEIDVYRKCREIERRINT